MPVYLNSKIKVNKGKHNFIVDTPELYVNNSTYKYYSDERMYPPTRDLTSASHTITGQAYGNGVYETDQSTYYQQDVGTTYSYWGAFSAFKSSDTTGYHGQSG